MLILRKRKERINISRWSLKCDFFDHLEIMGVLNTPEKFEEFKSKIKVYVTHYPDEDELLVFEAPEDLIPYYTHIIWHSCYNMENGGHIRLFGMSWLEMEEEMGYPNQYRLRLMKEFDAFVREHGKEPIWKIPLEERDKWKPCPMGEPYFCEPKLKRRRGNAAETVFCPYMYANRKMPCKLEKYRAKAMS